MVLMAMIQKNFSDGVDDIFQEIFADKEEEWELVLEDYKSPIPEKFKWKNWAANDEGLTGDGLTDFVNNELFPALKEINISQSPQAKIVKRGF